MPHQLDLASSHSQSKSTRRKGLCPRQEGQWLSDVAHGSSYPSQRRTDPPSCFPRRTPSSLQWPRVRQKYHRHSGCSKPSWCRIETPWLSLIHISEPTRQAEISYAV